MSNVLIVAEQGGGTLRKATLHAISAGRELAKRTGGKLHLALLGKGVRPVAEELSGYGAEVHLADAAALEFALAEAYAPVLADLVKATGATLVGGRPPRRGRTSSRAWRPGSAPPWPPRWSASGARGRR